jgi:hypothetical protein
MRANGETSAFLARAQARVPDFGICTNLKLQQPLSRRARALLASGILLGLLKLLERVERSGFVEGSESWLVQAGFYK